MALIVTGSETGRKSQPQQVRITMSLSKVMEVGSTPDWLQPLSGRIKSWDGRCQASQH